MVLSAPAPRILHMLWLQGLEDAPDMVRRCVQRWRELNPDYDLHLHDAQSAAQILQGVVIDRPDFTMQTRSNLLRLILLAEYGGVWADATIWPTQPLTDWLPDRLAGSGFFAFANPGPDRVLGTWFLAARPRHPLIDAWFAAEADYHGVPRGTPRRFIPKDPVALVRRPPPEDPSTARYPYFCSHYLFAGLIEDDPELARLWSQTAHLAARPAMALRRALLHRNVRASELPAILAKAPMQKLNWRDTYADALWDALAQLC